METDTDTIRLEPEHLDEIRASVDWQALFTGLGLKKVTQRSKPADWWAFSPFHDEKTPSFHMRPGGVWYDFSIGEGGGPIELVQRLERCNCFEAGRLILERGWATASVTLGVTDAITGSQTRRTRHKVRDALIPDDAPQNAAIRQDLRPLCTWHEALEERGLSEETCATLGIGYLAQGRSPLKGRIVFQVADARVTKKSEGDKVRVILSHLGRAISNEQSPKYLFYEGFHKSAELYGQDRLWLDREAAEQIGQTSAILLTEGPMDLAKAHEAGLRNVVASFGSALSEAQAVTLRQLAGFHCVEDVIVAYDRDEAGCRGAAKAAALLEAQGLRPRVFDWDAPVGQTSAGPAHIPDTITDLAEFSTEQLAWLRTRRLL